MKNELPIINDDIEDVEMSASAYLWKHHQLFIILAVTIMIILAILISVAVIFYNISENFLFLIILPFLVLIGLQNYALDQRRHQFMKQFAIANGFKYSESADMVVRPGVAFEIGQSRIITNLIAGTYLDYPIELFNYTYTRIGNGKQTERFYFTILEIDCSYFLPHIFLKNNDLNFGKSLEMYFKNEQKINLEGNFNKQFTLLTPIGWQIETLQIFTPDFMAKMLDHWNKFSLEFIGKRMYVYHSYHIGKKVTLYKMFKLAKYLMTQIGPLLSNMEKNNLATSQFFPNRL